MQDNNLNIYDISFINLQTEPYPNLQVHYANGKKININYQDKDFSSILKKVYAVYTIEKEKHNIIVFGQFNEEVVNYCLNSDTYIINCGYLQDNSVVKKEVLDDFIFSAYIKKIIADLIFLFTDQKDVTFGALRGFKNKYVLNYKVNGKKNTVSLILTVEGNTLTFNLSYIEGEVFPIEGEIEIKKGAVAINWQTGENEVIASTIYSIDEEIEEDIIRSRDAVLDLKKDSNITEKEYELLKQYFSMCGLDFPDKIKKTTDNNYIFLTLEDNSTLTSGHVTLKENKIIIHYQKQYGTTPYKQYLFLPRESYNMVVTIVPVDKENILAETYFEGTDKATGNYKNKYEGKYSYSLINASYKSLIEPFEVNEIYDYEEGLLKKEDYKTALKEKREKPLIEKGEKIRTWSKNAGVKM